MQCFSIDSFKFVGPIGRDQGLEFGGKDGKKKNERE